MRKLMWAGVLAAAFYGHGWYVFSEPAVMGWLQTQQRKELKAEDGFCDSYASDLRVSMRSETARGVEALEGGKVEMCEYVKDAVATLRATQSSVNIDTDLVSVERSGFPWLGATVTVRQTSTVRMPRMPAFTEVGEYTYELTRTLNGRQIVSIDGSSTMGMVQ
ncbi:hypothetical protein [Hydrogenophaga flava]|uniref:hypothetical protein n=1 Tax=Hydrogenophaga flava TaxID=65657 RepID=UPI000A435985|nr:hypothetical protein [Hydrogenophaga flava]